jgi:hypothetical protein
LLEFRETTTACVIFVDALEDLGQQNRRISIGRNLLAHLVSCGISGIKLKANDKVEINLNKDYFYERGMAELLFVARLGIVVLEAVEREESHILLPKNSIFGNFLVCFQVLL